uniref:Uncharacterized protein n=1 Tax=Lepeophtheirus salmonis TaxID=72036 RepID=A0A0K2THL8_LEPSM
MRANLLSSKNYIIRVTMLISIFLFNTLKMRPISITACYYQLPHS